MSQRWYCMMNGSQGEGLVCMEEEHLTLGTLRWTSRHFHTLDSVDAYRCPSELYTWEKCWYPSTTLWTLTSNSIDNYQPLSNLGVCKGIDNAQGLSKLYYFSMLWKRQGFTGLELSHKPVNVENTWNVELLPRPKWLSTFFSTSNLAQTLKRSTLFWTCSFQWAQH